MSAQHTPGRLIVRGGYSIYTADGTPVADTCLTASIPDNDEANARRLAACWNACEGLHTESLERNKPLGDQLVDAINQRDELLEALRLAEAALADIGDADREPGDDLAWCEARAAQDLPAIRAAIAKAEGQ